MRRALGIVLLCLLAPCAAGAVETPAEADTTGLADLSSAELFLRASSSALQFTALREPSRRLLVRNHDESVPYLVTQLDTDDARERHALEDVLVRIGAPAVEPLVVAFRAEAERTDTTRGARLAAGILGKLADPEAVEPLVEARGHGDWKIRSAIAGALGRIGSLEAAPALVTLLGDENEIARKSAAVALARVAEKGDGELGGDTLDALAAALDDAFYAVRYGAARSLAACGETTVRLLVELALENDGPAQLLAVRALGEIGSRRALAPLRELLGSDDWTVRAYAAEAIGRIGPRRRERSLLERALEDEHPFVALRASEALDADGSRRASRGPGR